VRGKDTEFDGELGDTEGIQSVEKALVVLDAMAERSGRYPVSLAELTRRTGFHRSSVTRYVISLVRAGYVQVDQTTQRYQLGPKVLRLAQQFVRQSDAVSRARHHLIRLRDSTGETAFFNLLVGEQRVVVAQEESLAGLRRSMEVGLASPLYFGAASKAILAFAEPSLIDQVLSRPLAPAGPGAATDPGEIRRQLEIIRQTGYAIGQNEIVEGAAAVCAPIFDHHSKVIGSIGIAGPTIRLSPEQRLEFAVIVKAEARSLSGELGYTEQD